MTEDHGVSRKGFTGELWRSIEGVYLPSVGSWTGRSTSVPIKSFI
jgi:hypothetical protein